MVYLKAIFWDYPQFTDEITLKDALKENPKSPLYRWIMQRFLEHGRVVDTFRFFRLDEVVENLPRLRLSDDALKKWKRMIEVYGRH